MVAEQGKDSKKKESKTAANGCKDEDEKLPYVHIRARIRQATNCHSLAKELGERRSTSDEATARAGPGMRHVCLLGFLLRLLYLSTLLDKAIFFSSFRYKISGTAMVLDKIISHGQSLQHQVEFLSLRLATVNPRIDFDIDSLLAAHGVSSMDSNFQNMVMPLIWPNGQLKYPQLCNNFDRLHIPEWGKKRKTDLC